MDSSTQLIALAPFAVVIALAALAAVVVVAVFLLGVLRIAFGGRKVRPMEAEEAKLMQDLNRGFQRLEERVESLETILLEGGAPRREFEATGAERHME